MLPQAYRPLASARPDTNARPAHYATQDAPGGDIERCWASAYAGRQATPPAEHAALPAMMGISATPPSQEDGIRIDWHSQPFLPRVGHYATGAGLEELATRAGDGLNADEPARAAPKIAIDVSCQRCRKSLCCISRARY